MTTSNWIATNWIALIAIVISLFSLIASIKAHKHSKRTTALQTRTKANERSLKAQLDLHDWKHKLHEARELSAPSEKDEINRHFKDYENNSNSLNRIREKMDSLKQTDTFGFERILQELDQNIARTERGKREVQEIINEISARNMKRKERQKKSLQYSEARKEAGNVFYKNTNHPRR